VLSSTENVPPVDKIGYRRYVLRRLPCEPYGSRLRRSCQLSKRSLPIGLSLFRDTGRKPTYDIAPASCLPYIPLTATAPGVRSSS